MTPMIERMVAWLILTFARTLTGVQAFWRGCVPSAEQRIYFSNHASHGDFVLIWATLPSTLRRLVRPIAGADYWNRSAIRRFIGGRVFRAVLIDRTRSEGAPDPVSQMREVLVRGDSLIMFPEGTRNTSDAPLLPLKSGLYHLATSHPRAKLIPVWINNLNRVMPKGELLPIPLICTVTYGAPLELVDDEPKQSFLDRARDALLALRPDDGARA